MVAMTARPMLTRDTLEQIGDRMTHDANRGRDLEREAERLQREVRAAVERNSVVTRHSQKQAQQVRSFEERSRDTLRDLMTDMGTRDGTRD